MQFHILDPPTIKGSTNDQMPAIYLNPTSDAVALLKAAVDQGKFVVEVGGLNVDSSANNVSSNNMCDDFNCVVLSKHITQGSSVKFNFPSVAALRKSFFCPWLVPVQITVLCFQKELDD